MLKPLPMPRAGGLNGPFYGKTKKGTPYKPVKPLKVP